MLRKSLVIVWLSVLLAAATWLFWYNEWIYSLPTPVPATYHETKRNDLIAIKDKISLSQKPALIHFFNPDCPCSRFNISHVKSLIAHYKTKIDFYVVVLTDNKSSTAERIQEKFGLEVPVFFDKKIADSCGVFSTPQAVLLRNDYSLYYRGNYNKSRYCTVKESDYARIAIDSLLNDCSNPSFSPYALKSYGCELPNCSDVYAK